MSLIYLVTRLPRLTLGEPAPMSRADFILMARDALEGTDLVEFERAAMLEEVEETVRTLHRARQEASQGRAVERGVYARLHRRPTALGRAVRDLPDWVLEPAPQHVLLRRYWQRLIQESRSKFMRDYANFLVDIEESSTALRCQREQLSRSEFLEQMSGHFDLSSRVIVDHYEQPDLGIATRFAWWPRLIAALDDEDRVEGERALHRLRFAAIEQIRSTDTFSIDVVLASYFQLRIVERESSWDKDKGLAVLDQVLTIPALERAIGAST